MAYQLEIMDDHSMMALVDPDAYDGRIEGSHQTRPGSSGELKVSPSMEQLRERFLAQMAQRTLLLWPTPTDATWDVRVVVDAEPGFDLGEVLWRDTGPLRASAGTLALTSHRGLVNVARFGEFEPYEAQEFAVTPGSYTCEVTLAEIGWVVRLTTGGDLAPWTRVAWERMHEDEQFYELYGRP